MQIYAKISGESIEFYNDDIHTPEQIPDDVIEISQLTWQTYLSNQSGYKINAMGELVTIPPLTPEELAERELNRPLTEMEIIGRQLVDIDLRLLEGGL